MKPRKSAQKAADNLRNRAEKRLKSQTASPKIISEKGTQKLIYELQVHQIELEMQNEELRKAQAELEESRARYSDLYDFAPVGYLTFDRNGLILEANLTAAKELVRERILLINKPFRTHIAPEDRNIFDQHLRQVLASENRQTCEIRLKRRDGTMFYAQLESISANDLKGNTLCRASVIEISERKKAEEKIRKFNEELEQKVRDRTAALEASVKEQQDFSYSISHDLRAPLRHINSYAELLNESLSGSLDENSQRYLRVISDSAKQIGVLMDALLEFVRIGRSEMRITTVNLDQLVEEAKNSQEAEIKARDILWKIDQLPEVYGDPAMLRIVVTTLISNSLKFTRNRLRAKIEIRCITKKDELIFSVKDNGVGFDVQYADKLFRVFQRLHPASEFEGIGVGLANVQRIIQRHNGRTWAEGKIEKGATFYFSLPNIKPGNKDTRRENSPG
ncbi:MAG: ATP-binding protein [Nitrospirota bacterium]